MASTGNDKKRTITNTSIESATKKPRKKSVAAKSLGLTKHEFNVIKEELNAIVKQLA